MKFPLKSLLLIILFSIFISVFSPLTAGAQSYSSIDNQFIIFWVAKQIIFKENYEAEANIYKENKVRRYHLSYTKGGDYFQSSATINKNGYVDGRFFYDTTQIPEQEVIVKFNEKNNPTFLFQYTPNGEKFIHFISYETNGNIKVIADVSDSAYYTVLQPEYSSNESKPLLNKLFMQRTEDIYKYVNFRYNDEGKLISVYKEGNPDMYKIKYELDKVSISSLDYTMVFKLKNGIFAGYNYSDSDIKYNYTTTITFSKNGLRESTTNTYADGETYTQYYTYEYYK